MHYGVDAGDGLAHTGWAAHVAPHHLDQGPEPDASYHLDLTPWLDAPTVHEMVGYIREVRDEPTP